METQLTTNELAFIALSNEYCHALEHADQYTNRDQLVAQMLKLLPRIYIAITDVDDESMSDADIISALDEDTYNVVRERLAGIMSDEDIYLEVFMQDMQYSDTPIAASVAEGLADLYQEFYNLIHTVADAPDYLGHDLLAQCKGNFAAYWGQTLCNLLRALNNIRYSIL